MKNMRKSDLVQLLDIYNKLYHNTDGVFYKDRFLKKMMDRATNEIVLIESQGNNAERDSGKPQ